MKKRTFVILLLILITILLISTVVFATAKDNSEQNKILTGKKISSISKTYEEINASAVRTNETNDIFDIANEYLENINATALTFSNETSIVKKFNNALESRQETVISNNESILKINSENGDLVSYVSNKTEFAINKLSEDKIKEKAIKIFNSLDKIDKVNYEMVYLEKFDDEIWRVGFAKKYDDKINQLESVKFSFCPQTEEIVTLAVNKVEYDGNEVTVSLEEARNIANSYLEKSVADNMEINIEIIRPNYFYEEALDDDSVYANICRMRKAYVCVFNNEAKSTVYVDCTTGEVIGGSMILGGEY